METCYIPDENTYGVKAKSHNHGSQVLPDGSTSGKLTSICATSDWSVAVVTIKELRSTENIDSDGSHLEDDTSQHDMTTLQARLSFE